ncbi:hypothetical protein MW290_03455 [Aquincola tertiaricarbonis]|uniref:Secreted protein n=1 Tax=Aquincola tertiaricarbonis TaxID=391953 RepID=A0ABY4S2K6_AQUTE|nr:hypothetical protein [Aquincola tertiaricarbonis]URI07688.1 hypothetical protein MW290_03455 [Aquincola tertiaricarbonis]
MRHLLATPGPFVPLAALLLGLAYLVLDPTPPRHVVVATRPARSDASEFGARTPVCHGVTLPLFNGVHSHSVTRLC